MATELQTTTSHRRFFPLEAASALAMIGFGMFNIVGAASGLHMVIAFYILVGGLFFSAIVIRRRRGPPAELPVGTNGLVKAIEKLAEPKLYGFTSLAVAPLPLGYGGFGILVFLLLYLSSVNAMRLSDEELMSWIGVPGSNVIVSPRAVGSAAVKKE